MGSYLSQPVTDKETHEGENDVFSYGVSAMQGWRTEMVRKKKKERGEGGGREGRATSLGSPSCASGGGRCTLPGFAWQQVVHARRRGHPPPAS